MVGAAAAAVGLTSIPGLGVFGDRYAVKVYTFVRKPAARYRRADLGHMANKIYPDVASAFKRRPHRGFKAEIKEALVYTKKPVTTAELFAGRRDIDFRSTSDMKHFQRFVAGNGGKIRASLEM